MKCKLTSMLLPPKSKLTSMLLPPRPADRRLPATLMLRRSPLFLVTDRRLPAALMLRRSQLRLVTDRHPTVCIKSTIAITPITASLLRSPRQSVLCCAKSNKESNDEDTDNNSKLGFCVLFCLSAFALYGAAKAIIHVKFESNLETVASLVDVWKGIYELTSYLMKKLFARPVKTKKVDDDKSGTLGGSPDLHVVVPLE